MKRVAFVNFIGKTRDARGRLVKLLNVPGGLVPNSRPEDSEVYTELKNLPGTTGKWFVVWIARILGVVLFVFGAQMLFHSAAAFRQGGLPRLAGLLAYSIVFMGLSVRFLLPPTVEPHKRRDFCLLKRRCASCGYDLSGNLPEADGATVCPECGAAWMLNTLPENHDPASG